MATEPSSQTWQDRLFGPNAEDQQLQSKEIDAAVADYVYSVVDKPADDPDFIKELEAALKISGTEKAHIIAEVDKGTRAVVEPVIIKALEFAGVDPSAADDAAIQQALSNLTPEQENLLQQIHDDAMQRVLEPLAREALAVTGDMEAASASRDDVYRELKRLADIDADKNARIIAAAHRPEPKSVALPAAALGFIAGIAVMKLWRWFSKRNSRGTKQ